jgi:serine/threonine protein kinase/Tol biopolymer transport system component
MAPERWQKIERLYHSALECAPESRAAFLKEATGGDEDLRREVVSLLEQSDEGMLDRPAWHALGEGGLNPGAAPKAGSFPESPGIDEATHEVGRERSRDTPSLQDTPSPAGPLIGQTISHYRIVEKLGAGGMGIVYRAEDIRLRRFVALKFLPGEIARDPDALGRFEREARAASALNHPNICTIYEVEEYDRQPVIVMELLEGETLKERIRSGLIPIDELVEFGIQTSGALEAAHKKRIIHRDIKPANIFISGSGHAKILDFGLAKRVRDHSTRGDATTAPTLTMEHQLTGEGFALGTVPYMSPEQVRAKDLDARTDLFSFGVVLYEMATGRQPFRGDSSGAVFDSILNRAPVPAVRLNPDVPAELDRIIGKCLEKDRDLRYQNASEIRADLQRLRRDTESAGTIAAAQEEIAAKRPRRWTAIILAVAATIAAGAGLVWRFGAPRRPVTSPSEYIQLTNFNDSATAPALSPDGRMMAFFRGGEYFLGSGQLYVKLLPDGESKQLTFDSSEKYDPVFTPDASRVAYTSIAFTTSSRWNTWTVPVLGGPPTRLMVNAAGLSWIGPDRVLFSEIMEGTVLHMGIVTAKESRAEEREIYFPEHERAMAHYSWLSPDRNSVLIVEMNGTTNWQRCRALPMEGNSVGVQVGPEGACIAAQWSPDGQWMYLNVNVDGSTHLWRQRWRDRAPQGNPEQITFGPNEEEGVAVAPDGKSLIASVGVRQSTVSTHDAAGDHAVSLEGSAQMPWLSPDGKRLYYLLRKSSSTNVSELWRRDLASGKSDPLLTGQRITDYDVSRDEARVAFTVLVGGEPQIFLAATDRSSAPRLVVRGGDMVTFGAGQLFFRQLGGKANYLGRVQEDGSGLTRVLETKLAETGSVSPDGEWVTLSGRIDSVPGTSALSLRDGTQRKICVGPCVVQWSADGKYIYVSTTSRFSATVSKSRTYMIPIPHGFRLLDLPAAGIDGASKEELAGFQSIPQAAMSPGPDLQTYAYATAAFHGNLFRIPLH